MKPSVTQQLEAVRRRILESIVPELPPEAAFAREQSQIVCAALQMLIECHEHEYRYAVVENHDYRQLLERLSALATTSGDEVGEILRERAPDPDDGTLLLGAITEQTERMKVEADRLSGTLAANPSTEQQCAALLAEIAVRQVEREASWYRTAGFSGSAPSIGALLAGTMAP